MKETIRLEITHTDPEKTPERLSLKLIEAYNNVSIFERQAQDYRHQASDERRKGSQIQIILSSLKEWRKKLKEDQDNGIERKISRMEPMLSYDYDELVNELSKYQTDANKYHEMSDDFRAKAESAKRDTVVLQIQIKEGHAKSA